ncbi:nickel-dependent hydrogenase large subunit [Magnetovibrio sp. PR-2]|uniref:nickel-dependent hydrogenase large subunit n=1 Tax=Magnetovibrio sp. PR-2 TaxID=3120356 RepID=UPI002FCE37C6
MTKRIIGPFNRVEGDLEVTLDIDAGLVKEAHVNASMFRGFEQILQGRPALDALSITPRICGICSVSQSVASAQALSEAFGITPEPNGQLGVNLVHAAENLSDHLTHFYLFFMPDFARKVYAEKSWYGDIEQRFCANAGTGAAQWLKARARLLHITGILAGKWPHSLAIQPGGLTRSPDVSDLIRVRSVIADTRVFLESNVFGCTVEEMAGLSTLDDLNRVKGGDLARFMTLVDDLGLADLGQGYARFMSFGAYHLQDANLWRSGVMDGGVLQDLKPDSFDEDPAHAWVMGDKAHPAQGDTQPFVDREGAYSWCKAARVDSQPVEVGAVARQLVAGQPLISALIGSGPANVFVRILARMVESARLIQSMESWIGDMEASAPVCVDDVDVHDINGEGAGLVEAARGSLGHWMRVKRGEIQHYQIIAPTTWNFSPRDGQGIPGPLEHALAGTAVDESEKSPVQVQHVVRSFDPCMVCTVH